VRPPEALLLHGVEIAGQIGELTRDTLRRSFRNIEPEHARIMLVEMGDRLLSAFPESLSKRATRSLTKLGVEPSRGVVTTLSDDPDFRVRLETARALRGPRD